MFYYYLVHVNEIFRLVFLYIFNKSGKLLGVSLTQTGLLNRYASCFGKKRNTKQMSQKYRNTETKGYSTLYFKIFFEISTTQLEYFGQSI